MAEQTEAYKALTRGIARRRRVLIRSDTGRMIAPPSGTVWFPSEREQAYCESYIVMVAAELEAYLEEVVGRALAAYMAGCQASFMSSCDAGSDFYNKVKKKADAWASNNNTRWDRVSNTIQFIGLKPNDFPCGMWDDIDAITVERGGIVHQGIGARVVNDPRPTLEAIDRMMARLRLFDRDFALWILSVEGEVARISTTQIRFTGGLGTIGA